MFLVFAQQTYTFLRILDGNITKLLFTWEMDFVLASLCGIVSDFLLALKLFRRMQELALIQPQNQSNALKVATVNLFLITLSTFLPGLGQDRANKIQMRFPINSCMNVQSLHAYCWLK